MYLGIIYACYFYQGQKLGNVATESRVKLNIQPCMNFLVIAIKKPCKKFGTPCLSIMCGSMSPYEICATTKAKQKNLTKSNKGQKAKVDCGRLYYDILMNKSKDGE